MIGVVTVLVNTDTPVMVGDTITLTINLLRHSASAYLFAPLPSCLGWFAVSVFHRFFFLDIPAFESAIATIIFRFAFPFFPVFFTLFGTLLKTSLKALSLLRFRAPLVGMSITPSAQEP